jgi:hypothetical protein
LAGGPFYFDAKVSGNPIALTEIFSNANAPPLLAGVSNLAQNN